MENVLGSLEFSLSGAELISHITSNDMLLLKLNETPPLEYSTYYAGWNTSKTISNNVYTFHHPQGDVKKYSLSKSAPETGTFYFDNINFSSNVHWLVDGWQIGLTEAGSSGSPLFDSEDRVIGALTGGYDPSGCGKRNLDAFYRLNAAWTSRMNKNTLSSHLDPLGTRRFSLPCIVQIGRASCRERV